MSETCVTQTGEGQQLGGGVQALTEGMDGGAQRQPRAVWAVAFACTVSFMGIGFVDPILPTIAVELHGTAAQTELLFTSYMLVTAFAMLFSGWIAARIGQRATLSIGLATIVVFAGLASTSGSIAELVGWRAGWGLGNSLYLTTALAVLVGTAAGGSVKAVSIYEAAMGTGFAIGPLVGGMLGGVSWRLPFVAVSVLMLLATVAAAVFVPALPRPVSRPKLSAPFVALRDPALRHLCFAAFCYNWAFFLVLAYSPLVMELDHWALGFVFAAWGTLVAVFAVFVAPRVEAVVGTFRLLGVSLTAMSVLLAGMFVFADDKALLAGLVIASGAFIGINNTVMTQSVMETGSADRGTISAAYGFVRFIGGGLSPAVAGLLSVQWGESSPYALGMVLPLIGVVFVVLAARVERRDHRIDEADLHPLGQR